VIFCCWRAPIYIIVSVAVVAVVFLLLSADAVFLVITRYAFNNLNGV